MRGERETDVAIDIDRLNLDEVQSGAGRQSIPANGEALFPPNMTPEQLLTMNPAQMRRWWRSPLSDQYRKPNKSYTTESHDDTQLQYYFNDLRNYPQLEPEGQVLLATAYQAVRDFEQPTSPQVDQASQQPEHVPEGDQLKQDQAAWLKDVLYTSNLRLVITIAKRYPEASGGSLADHIQSGNEGLHRAIKKFDVQKGFKFSTYANFWIKQNIQRQIDSAERPIKIPHKLSPIMKHLADHTAAMVLDDVHAGELEAYVAHQYQLDPAEAKVVCTLFLTKRTVGSLNRTTIDGSSSELEDAIPSDMIDVEHQATARLLRGDLLDVIKESGLNARERRIIKQLYFGPNDSDNTAQRNHIAKELGVRPDHVSRLARLAIKKIAAEATSSNKLDDWRKSA